MFTSGLKFQTRFEKADGKIGAAIIVGSTVIPFICGWLITYLFNLKQFLGPANNVVASQIVVLFPLP